MISLLIWITSRYALIGSSFPTASWRWHCRRLLCRPCQRQREQSHCSSVRLKSTQNPYADPCRGSAYMSYTVSSGVDIRFHSAPKGADRAFRGFFMSIAAHDTCCSRVSHCACTVISWNYRMLQMQLSTKSISLKLAPHDALHHSKQKCRAPTKDQNPGQCLKRAE